MADSPDLSAAILDTALQLAESCGWERLRLRDVADALGITLDDIRSRYAQKDDLAEAWFDRADRAMLLAADAPDLAALGTRERLHRLLMAWLDALAAHRVVTRDMLLYRLEPAHIHLQAAGLMRISRTVQWLREAAGADTTHLRRIMEEVGLTSIYLLTFSHWLTDASPGQQRSRDFLARRLRDADACARRLDGLFPRRPRRAW